MESSMDANCFKPQERESMYACIDRLVPLLCLYNIHSLLAYLAIARTVMLTKVLKLVQCESATVLSEINDLVNYSDVTLVILLQM